MAGKVIHISIQKQKKVPRVNEEVLYYAEPVKDIYARITVIEDMKQENEPYSYSVVDMTQYEAWL